MYMGRIGANGQKAGQKVKIFVFTLLISQYQHGKTNLFIALFAQSNFGPPKNELYKGGRFASVFLAYARASLAISIFCFHNLHR